MKRVTVKGIRKKLPTGKKRVFLLLALIVLVAAGLLYYFFGDLLRPVKLDPNENTATQVSTLDTKDINKLANADVDPNEDFVKAHAKALALYQQGDYKAAAEVYKGLVDTGTANHEVYAEYAAVLFYGGDKAAGVNAMKTAVEKVRSSKLSQADKDSILRVYNNQLKAYEEG